VPTPIWIRAVGGGVVRRRFSHGYNVREELTAPFFKVLRMSRRPLASVLLLSALACGVAHARPYPVGTGLAASADSAQTASSNPAAIARFSKRAVDADVLWLTSESEWESEFGGTGNPSSSRTSSDTVVPRFAIIQPINDRFTTSFTFLGTGISDDLGDWPGLYFIESYDSVFVSAFPSLAYRIDDHWSVAVSAAITYSSFEQQRAVRNVFDPGFGDGRSKLEADSVEVGFGLSMLYQHSERTRWGLTYNSEINPSRSADNELSGLGPNTEVVMQQLGILDADLSIQSTSPESMVAGLYHEFADQGAVTADLAWVNFSDFRLSEFYFDGQSFVRSNPRYNDLYALSASYSWPVSERWMLGVGGLVTNQMIDDDERTMTLRLDALWSLGLAAEWRWTDSRNVKISMSYVGMDDAPVSTPSIPGFGSLEGRFTRRDTLLFQVGMSWNSL
jgi:long-chain fatty acid transport protein